MSRRVLVLAAVLVALAAGVWLAARLTAPPPSEEDRIRAAFEEAARAATAHETGGVMALVSERFRGGGLDRREVHQLVAGELLRASWASVTLAGLRVAVQGDSARANADVVLAGATGKGKGVADLLPSEASAYRFRCALSREPEGWRVTTAEWMPITLAEVLAGPPEAAGAGGKAE